VQGHKTKGGHRENDYELNCHSDNRNYWGWILETKATKHRPCIWKCADRDKLWIVGDNSPIHWNIMWPLSGLKIILDAPPQI